jgi:septum formation protein
VTTVAGEPTGAPARYSGSGHQTGVRLILASASPARLRTLRDAGVSPEVIVSGFDESTVSELDPAQRALLLAELKARAVADRVPGQVVGVRRVVVGCDSLFEFEGQGFGKPGSAAEARRRLGRMSGHSGVLHTGHFVLDLDTGRHVGRVASTVVNFAALSSEDIDAYVSTGEPLDVAGAFTIDGLAGAFVDSVNGDPHNVVGISLPLLRRMLGELEITWTSLWTTGSLDRQTEASGDQDPLNL